MATLWVLCIIIIVIRHDSNFVLITTVDYHCIEEVITVTSHAWIICMAMCSVQNLQLGYHNDANSNSCRVVITVEPLDKGHTGDNNFNYYNFVLCRGCPLPRGCQCIAAALKLWDFN